MRAALKVQNSRFYALREPELLSVISAAPMISIGGRLLSLKRALNIGCSFDTNDNSSKKETSRVRRLIVREMALSYNGNVRKDAVLRACERNGCADGALVTKVLSEMCTSSGGVWSINLEQ